jgi:hypothetical protein
LGIGGFLVFFCCLSCWVVWFSDYVVFLFFGLGLDGVFLVIKPN